MKYGLIGEHLPHSFSAEIHAKIADYTYELHEVAREHLDAFMKEQNFCGINVTIPYKQAVIPYLTEIDENAEAIGAVNTVLNKDGKLLGYNTDFFGICALIRKTGIHLDQKKVLILGTGGTSHTAKTAASALGAGEIVVVGRKAGTDSVSYADAYQHHTDADVIINTTPCGMFPHPDGTNEISGTPIDIDQFPSLKGVIDVIYNPLRTNLILNAKKRGIPAAGGLYMLVAQAVAAAEYFTGSSFDPSLTDSIYGDIRASKENIVLTGMPGSGKTTVGKLLSEKLHRPFYDTDALIVKQTGRSISDLFAEYGDSGFRKIESETIASLCATSTGAVIATGGGAILKDENVHALKRNGRLYFLNRNLSKIVPTADRPLALDREALEARFRERYGRYCETADVEIKIDEKTAHTIKAITEDFYDAHSGH